MDWTHEPFLADRAGACGATRAELRRAIRNGTVRQIFRRVYVAAEVPDSLDLRAKAASLVLPPHAVVSDRSAAWLYGVDVFDPASLDVPPPLEVVSVAGSAPPRLGGVVGGERDLLPSEIAVVRGVRVTTPVRTAADLGCLRGRLAAFAALSMLAHDTGFGTADLLRILPRFDRRRGVIQLRELAPKIEPRCDSPGECWTLLPILDAGLPRPTPQYELVVEGWGRVALDFAYPHLKVAVEYDGEEFHGEEQREHDERRRWYLRQMGWIVIVVRKQDLKGAPLDAWLGELRGELERARKRRVYSRAPRAGGSL